MPPLPKHTGAFDAVRLIAAFAVLDSHSYALLRLDAFEPMAVVTGGKATLGEVAVYAFFALSGYLVSKSWLSHPVAYRFMIKRVLRIVPALAFVIAGSVIIAGLFLTDLRGSDFFLQRRTLTYLTKIFIYPTQYDLPGTFAGNPYPDVVNGSLCSLRLEFFLYIVVCVLGLLGLMRRWVAVGLASFSLGMCVLLREYVPTHMPMQHEVTLFFFNAVPFFIGSALAQSNLASKGLRYLAIGLAVLTALAIARESFYFLLVVALPLAVILIARQGRCDLTSRFGDYSYGVYLWAFPVQLCLIHFIPGQKPLSLTLIAGAVTFGCAVLSWHLVEKRALGYKPRQASFVDSFAPQTQRTGFPLSRE